MDQAAMIQRANLESVPEESDRAGVERRYSALAIVSLPADCATPSP